MHRYRSTTGAHGNHGAFGRRALVPLGLAVGLTAALALPAVATATPPPAPQPATHSAGRRYGVVPARRARSASAPAPATTGTSSGSYLPLQYQGGYNGQGVTTGPPQVYLVFWGSQWGTPSTNSQGQTTFSLDADGLAPYLQSFLAGLGTNGETWSGVVTQYCQGVSVSATSCPSNAPHVPAPTGGVLAGVWADTSSPTPSQATWSQLAQEAINGSVHFGNTTAASNRNAQYFVVSPSGTNPDGFGTSTGGFCAWHDAVTSSAGPIPFINMPYVPDLLQSCGMNAVNAGPAGTLDGVSIVGGHEYSETLTDPYPAMGWVDSNTEETSDKCGWGGGAVLGNTLADISLATGSFAVQPNWANDANGATGGCELAHPVVTTSNSSSVISVSDPGGITTSVGASASLPISATDSAGLALTYDATGLPAGLSLATSTGIISGTPLAWPSSPSPASWADIVTVQAVDSTGANSLTSFVWTIVNSTVSISTPSSQASTSGTGASLQIAASDSAGGTLTYSAGGLPPGLSIGTSTGLISGTPVTAGSYGVSVAATDPWGATASTSFSWTVSPPGSAYSTVAGLYTALAPTRIMDTRTGPGPIGSIGPNSSVTLDLTGIVPTTATAVALNVTGVQPSQGTYVSVYPAGDPSPTASNLNLPAGAITPDLVMVPLGTNQSVTFYNAAGDIQLLADLQGYFAPQAGALYTPKPPARVMDTRSPLGATGPVGPNSTVTLSLSGIVPTTATAVVLNVTGVQPSEGTYVSVYPAGDPLPTVSNLNLPAEAITPNLVVVPLGTNQSVTFYNAAGDINLLADLQGYYGPAPGGAATVVEAPTRVMDTRTGPGPVGTIGPNSSVTLNLTGIVPVTATAVIMNVTGVLPTAGTYVSVYPAGEIPPTVSNLNLPASAITPNLVVVPLGTNQSVTFYNAAGDVNLLADLAGYTVPTG